MPDLYRAGDRVIAEVCTKWTLCGAPYEVAKDQEPGQPVFLKVGPILEIPVDPSGVRHDYDR